MAPPAPRPEQRARWWEPAERGKVLCTLCPRYCRIGDGQAGFCFIRQNHGGTLYNLGYGSSTGFALDPIEKKPLSHYLPGTSILSFGTAGCNLACKFCQNWSISKARLTQTGTLSCTASQVVELAKRKSCSSIACTYNDPVIYAEWMDHIGRAAGPAGLGTVAVTAGYITPEAREEAFRHVDAANVDLKAFSERFYRKLTLSHLAPVLDFLLWLKHETTIWLEVTTLLIEGHNDSDEELTAQYRWMLDNLGPDVPLHLTAFHPAYKLQNVPRTKASTLRRARELALAAGLHFVYTGNVHDQDGQTTWCPDCRMAVIERDWHDLLAYRLVDTNRCGGCGAEIAGRFQADHPFQGDQPDPRYHGGRRDYLPFSKRIFKR